MKYEEQGVLEDGDSHHSDDTHRTGYYADHHVVHGPWTILNEFFVRIYPQNVILFRFFQFFSVKIIKMLGGLI